MRREKKATNSWNKGTFVKVCWHVCFWNPILQSHAIWTGIILSWKCKKCAVSLAKHFLPNLTIHLMDWAIFVVQSTQIKKILWWIFSDGQFGTCTVWEIAHQHALLVWVSNPYPLFTRTAKIGSDCTKSDGKIEIFLSFLDGQQKSDQFWLFV